MHQCRSDKNPTVMHCGCVIHRCGTCGVQYAGFKCNSHGAETIHDSRSYYLDELKSHDNGLPRHTEVAGELVDALKGMGHEIPYGEPEFEKSLDIGAGVGLYAPMLMGKGYRYEAVEVNNWACEYIKGAYSPHVFNICFEDFEPEERYRIIVAAHVVEHFSDAPMMLRKIRDMLSLTGGAYIIVPDNTDLCNPDHKWFFTKDTLVAFMVEAGFRNVKACVKRIVERENFIYAVGSK